MSELAPPQKGDLWAAIDLGSNSFHLLLLQADGPRWRVLETLKEKVQLLAGFRNGRIAADALERGLNCMTRFAQRLHEVPKQQIAVMGTYALRSAVNTEPFLAAIAERLGVEPEVITGEREAQLIFDAVRVGVPRTLTPQLVIDIGGGSTELSIGNRQGVQVVSSLEMGCVAYKEAFFAVGQSSGYAAAYAAAAEQLRASPSLPDLLAQDVAQVFGTSGTIESMQTVLRANGWGWDEITAEGMQRLDEAIRDEYWLVDAGLPGLAPDRVDIFPPGVAILKACFDILGLSSLRFVKFSLLHGMIIDAMDKDEQSPLGSKNMAEASVQDLAHRFQLDAQQAARVEYTARSLLDSSGLDWADPAKMRDWLRWAATLHELGMQVNARHYHRHGAYMVRHADLAGIEDEERHILALLIRGHRRNLPGLAFQAF